MTLIQWAKTYCLTFVVFLAVDFLWLGLVARQLYQRFLGHLFREDVNWTAALLFYAIFVFGMMVFVVYPAIKSHSAMQAVGLGMLYGLVTYAAFDLTNLAVIKGWPATIVVVDIAWGMALSGMVSTAGYGIAKWLS
jgi:uncharacterized membrane protein